jgi:hypothetical protein
MAVLRESWWNHLSNPTNARSKKGDRTRPPPRGGWRGHERDDHEWKKTSGRGRDGGSTARGRRGKRDFPPATNKSSLLRMNHAEASGCVHPQYSPCRPFPSLRSRHSGTLSLGAAPPSRRGAIACALSFLRYTSLHTHGYHHPSARLKAAPPEVARCLFGRSCAPSGGAASCRAACPSPWRG